MTIFDAAYSLSRNSDIHDDIYSDEFIAVIIIYLFINFLSTIVNICATQLAAAPSLNFTQLKGIRHTDFELCDC